MENDQIKFAFAKVKQDILYLQSEVSQIKSDISEIKKILFELYNSLNIIKYEKNVPTDRQTFQQTNPTHSVIPTDNPTVPQELKGLKSPNLSISIGNEGVPTDRQTDRQTDQQTQKSLISPLQTISSVESNILEASEILNSLDRLKREIRLKFKQLTSQEMIVFSTIYQLEEKDPQNTTYNQIASILHLSESSIRDYVLKMIKKGIPIKKHKINNRKVVLFISNELKKIATLSTILQLREL